MKTKDSAKKITKAEESECFTFNGETISHEGMNRVYRIMNSYFGDDIELLKAYGPAPECVFLFSYVYKPKGYIIELDCERGFLVDRVKNDKGERFLSYFIYPEVRRAHFEDKEEDVDELVKFLHKSLTENEIEFYTDEQISRKNKGISNE